MIQVSNIIHRAAVFIHVFVSFIRILAYCAKYVRFHESFFSFRGEISRKISRKYPYSTKAPLQALPCDIGSHQKQPMKPCLATAFIGILYNSSNHFCQLRCSPPLSEIIPCDQYIKI